ncbi:hypothetical protein [Photorhabdus khanii]|uniref:Uncharacterized protein n=1 Tax=Photorhabdus khanii subsp. guanajuatensis TaxID=2100166 RepID=A0A4R4IPM6_9GAMM|nr:hypothetical protein [Photorhabdus khanii]TDB42586.1 hypothetical protein C5467_23805 [Photorhabdus khanii subsp. guanajuatensis]
MSNIITSIEKIDNTTEYSVILAKGLTSEVAAVGKGQIWSGSMWIPWIGQSSENDKVITITGGPAKQSKAFLFQDYNDDKIKYGTGKSFNYDNKDNIVEVRGDSAAGRRLVLSIDDDNDSFILTVTKF